MDGRRPYKLRCSYKTIRGSTMYGRVRIRMPFLAALGIASCGGGGSSTPPPPMLSVNASTLTFHADAPFSPRPAAQTLSGSVSGSLSGTLYVLITIDSAAVVTVDNVVISGTTGSVTVTPLFPSALGAGTYHATITVHACLNSSTCLSGELAGSPKTVAVNYDVGSTVQADTVMPHAVASQSQSDLVLRGHGFTAATGVTIGGLAATAGNGLSETGIPLPSPVLSGGNRTDAF